MGVRSSVPTRKDRQDIPGLRMEAIKKKMQAMKQEKDNLCDRCDEVEQKAKEAHIRQEKAEEECTELTNKARTLEIDSHFFTRWGIQESSIEITADHQIGKSLVID